MHAQLENGGRAHAGVLDNRSCFSIAEVKITSVYALAESPMLIMDSCFCQVFRAKNILLRAIVYDKRCPLQQEGVFPASSLRIQLQGFNNPTKCIAKFIPSAVTVIAKIHELLLLPPVGLACVLPATSMLSTVAGAAAGAATAGGAMHASALAAGAMLAATAGSGAASSTAWALA
eukprot:scaffold161700_cov21-Tisochrysis_lutea.AAC.1